MPPYHVDGSRFIVASPSKSVAKTGVVERMFMKIDLEMPEEVRGNINEILIQSTKPSRIL